MKIRRSGSVASVAMLVALCGSASAQRGALPARDPGSRWQPQRIPEQVPGIIEAEEPIAPLIACFAPGTDWQYVNAIQAQVNQLNFLNNPAGAMTDYFTSTRWPGTLGSPTTIRWSFVPDGTQVPNLSNVFSASNLFSTMDSAFAGQGGRATWMNRFTQSFDRWAQINGNTYVRVRFNNQDWDDGAAFPSTAAADGLRGDVRIGMRALDGASGTLAFNYFPTTGDMVLDANDIGSFASTTNQNIFLRNVIMHEHGHGQGLQHVCSTGGASNNVSMLMNPFINTGFDGPRQDDIRGSHALYGDDFSPSSQASPWNLGNIALGQTLNFGTVPAPLVGTADASASILSVLPNRTRWYQITVTGPLTLSMTATPVGSTYQNNQQAGNGSCPTGTTTDALRQALLRVTVFAPNGTTVLGQGSAASLGSAASASGILNAAGTYRLRVDVDPASTGPGQIQGFRLGLTAGTASGSFCPQIGAQPQSATRCAGQSVTFTADATGFPVPNYQWRKDGDNIPGATGPTLTIPSPTVNDQGSYDVVASNACGNATSQAAQLVVWGPITFSDVPPDQSVPEGGSITLSVTVNGGFNQGQWSFNGENIPGATADSFTINNFSADNEGFYRFIAVSPCFTNQSPSITLSLASQPPACYANCDGSTSLPVLNALDFSCFLNRYLAQDPYANCDGSTNTPSLNALDFSCFLNRYRQGCP